MGLPIEPVLAGALFAAASLHGQEPLWIGLEYSTQPLGHRVAEIEQALLDLSGAAAGDDDVRATAWLTLAWNANGTTLRTGPHRRELKDRVTHLRRLLGDTGRGVEALGDRTREEVALLALAFAQTCLSVDYKLLYRNVRICVAEAVRRAEAADAPAPTVEEVALLAMCVRVLSDDDSFAPQRDALLAIVTDAVRRLPRGEDRFVDAVRHYASIAQRRAADPSAKVSDPARTVAMCWPADALANPLHAWLGAFAVRDLDARIRQQQHTAARQLLAARGPDELWHTRDDPLAIRTTAMLAGVLGMTAPARADGREQGGR